MSSVALSSGVELFAELDPHMQLTTMLTFLFIAQRSEVSQKTIETHLGFSNAAASRNVSYWSDLKKYGVPGQGFVERFENPTDRREKLIRLTDRGQAFYDRVCSHMHKAKLAIL